MHQRCYRCSPSPGALIAALPVEFEKVAAARVRRPAAVVAKRARPLKYLRGVDRHLEPQRSALFGLLPGDSPLRNVNFPIAYFPESALNYPGSQFLHYLTHGVPIVGGMSATDVLGPRARGKRSSPSRSGWSTPRNLREFGWDSTEFLRRCLSARLSGQGRIRSLGWATAHRPPADGVSRTTPPRPKFAISEQHGANRPRLGSLETSARAESIAFSPRPTPIFRKGWIRR